VKRSLFAALFSVIGLNCAVYAGPAEPTLSGDFNYAYESEKPDGSTTIRTGETTFRLKAEAEIGNRWSLFTRYGYRGFSIDNSDATISKIDQYGLTYANDKAFKAVIGVQDVIVGPFGTLIDLTDNVGDGMLTGVSLERKDGDITYRAFGGKLDKHLFGTEKDQTTYGLEFTKQFHDFSGVVEYVGIDNPDLASKDYYGLGFSKALGKSEFLLEYVWSPAENNQNGTVYAVNYQASDKDLVSVTYRDVKVNATPGVDGVFGYNDEQGTVLSWERSLNKVGALTVEYDWNETISDGTKSKTLTLEYNYAF
jgi:hypothetical protein